MKKSLLVKACATLLLLVSVVIFYNEYYKSYERVNVMQTSLNYFFDSNAFSAYEKDSIDLLNYKALLNISSINLEYGLLDIDDPLNDISNNVEVLEGSVMPNVEGGDLYLAAHSGASDVSFFKNLSKVCLDDEVVIYYEGYKYTYTVVNIYEVEKTGLVEVNKDFDENSVVLITCINDNQLVVIAKFVNKEEF